VGQLKSTLLTLTSSTEYAEAGIASDIDSVVDVVFESSSDSLNNLFNWADVEVNPYTWVYSHNSGGYSGLVQYMQYRELAKEVVSAELDWDWDRAKRSLIIMPTPTAGSRVLVTYISTDVDLVYLTNYEMSIFRKYALAMAMKKLAIIRMKIADKPGAIGNFTMDGDAMWANAEAIEQDLEEKARQLQAPVGFIAD
jgi:hypothetical protein